MKDKNYHINLLKTNFNMKGNLNELETKYIKLWNFQNIYKQLMKNFNIKFILHDGPPYANGSIHLGHIFNKILKDIIIKYKTIIGFKCPFILGWDCFGLSIEKNITNLIKEKNIIKLQKLINNYTKLIVKNQKLSFINLGLLIDKNNIYKTSNYKNISEEIRFLNNLKKKNLLFTNFKSLYWCYKCENFLSESEIIYYKTFDISIILIFLFLNLKKLLYIYKFKNKYILGGLLIWTTLPWTILENQGICTDPELLYCLINTISGLFIINFKFYKNFYSKIKIYLININLGVNFKNLYFINPLFKVNKYYYKYVDIYIKKNITLGVGTGFIHISPNRADTDYLIYKENNKNLTIKNILSLNGLFLKKFNLFKKNKIEFINNNLLRYLLNTHKIIKFIKYNHDYMFCKIHKIKINYKLSKQWFIDFKYIFKFNIKNIKFIPFNSRKKFLDFIKKKPDWNISRNRIWGIPISILDYIKYKNFVNISSHYIKYISNYYELYGNKYWYITNKKDIIKMKFLFIKKLNNTLDVWFDSGTTHWHVVRVTHKNILKFPSDIYLEGEDQNRGWFQSSLITSILLNNKLPFKIIINHNFIKTITGEKLSKSLGNFINYKLLLKYINIDILRLLICNIKYTKQIILSQQILNQSIEIYRKLRNCFKFILSNISDYKNHNKLTNKVLININKWFISYIHIYNIKIYNLYNNYKFNKIISLIKYFISEDLSGLYFNLIKNYLYINILNSKIRKAIQVNLYFLLKFTLIILFPILPFTTQEAWNFLYFKKLVIKNKYFIFKKYKFLWYISWLLIKFTKFKFYEVIDKLKLKNLINFNLNIKLKLFSKKKFNFIINKSFIKNLSNLLLIKNFKTSLLKSYKNFIILVKIYKIKYKCKRCWSKIYKINLKLKLCKFCFIILFKQNIKL